MTIESGVKRVLRLSTEEWVEAARRKSEALSGFVTALIQTHANNRELVYSRRLSDMLGPSYAAHALNDLQKSSFSMELTRLCALWDSPSPDRVSLPTLMCLIADPQVVQRLERDHAAGWGGGDIRLDNEEELSAEDREHFQAMFRRRNDEFVGQNFRRNLRLSLCGVAAVWRSDRLRGVFNHRDRFIAHNLEAESLGRAGTAFRPPRYGQERKLLGSTQRLANALTVVIRNRAFAYGMSHGFSTKNSNSLFRAIRIVGAE